MPHNTGPLSLLEVDIDAICRNYLLLQKQLARGSDCAAVVKADAYGLGAQTIAPSLYAQGCRHFYVAHAAEGLALREALKEADAHIYVLHGIAGVAADEFLHARLVPVLNSPGDVADYVAVAKAQQKKLPAVLQIDTGMNRLGLSAAEVAALDKNLLAALDLRYVMSHLACADTPAHPKNKQQLQLFKKLTAALGQPCRLSFANSAGIFLGTDYHFDQARPGCALYGINPSGEGVNAPPNPMTSVVSVKARILQIREAAAGETVGYGAGYKLSAPARLATISAGYADGLLRSCAENGMVYIGGRACKIAGRISMDAIVADVTGHEGPAPRVGTPTVGEWAEILGPNQTVDTLAAAAGTIGYEVLTSLGSRYKRIYKGQNAI